MPDGGLERGVRCRWVGSDIISGQGQVSIRRVVGPGIVRLIFAGLAALVQAKPSREALWRALQTGQPERAEALTRHADRVSQ